MDTRGGLLLEREEELGSIARQLESARAGQGTLTLVEGPAGIGKTRLLDAAAALGQEAAMAVLRARGGVLEQELDHGVTRQLLDREPGSARLDELLEGPAAPAAVVFGLAPPATAGAPGHDPSAEILHALHRVAEKLAEQAPLLVVIDDAHWADASSLRAAAHTAARLAEMPAALVIATRDDEPGSNRELVVELFAGASPVYLHPGPLSARSVSQLLRRELGADPGTQLEAACARAAAGNPFVATELARDLAATRADPADISWDEIDEGGPLTVRRFLAARLDRLDADARGLAGALAILGGEGQLGHAAAIAGLDSAAADRAAAELAATGIAEGDRRLRLIHPLMRAAAVAGLGAATAASLHRRAYEVLRAGGEGRDALTRHALQAASHGDGELVDLLVQTAGRAMGTGAPDMAIVHLRRALAEPPARDARGAVLASLGQAEVRSGSFADGRAHLEQALGLLDDPGRRLEAHRERAFAAFALGGVAEARAAVEPVLAGLDGHRDDDVLQMEADVALLAWLSGEPLSQHLRRYLDLPGQTRAERTVLSLLAQAEHAAGADPATVVELAERALGGGRLVEQDTSEALSWYMATYALLTCEAHPQACATIEAALADGRRRASVFAQAGALGCRAVLALNEGRPRDAEADARTAAQGAMPPTMVPVNAAYIALALVDQGQPEQATRELADAGLERFDGPTVMRWVTWARARAAEQAGSAEAVREAVGSLEADDRAGQPMRALAWRALLARALARHEPGQAQALAADQLRWAERWGRPGALGVAQRAAALSADASERTDRLEAAVATLESSALRTEEARARADLGVALLRGGHRREGRAQLEAAVEVALACHARGVAEAATAELEVAGAAPRPLAFDELTASERRVAELAAAGAGNREIAEALLVTPKTVHNHLTRVYAKLGVTSRDELACAL